MCILPGKVKFPMGEKDEVSLNYAIDFLKDDRYNLKKFLKDKPKDSEFRTRRQLASIEKAIKILKLHEN